MSLWSAVLGDITEALGGIMADLIVSHPLERRQVKAALYNWPDDLHVNRHPKSVTFAAQWLSYMLPCQRFTGGLTTVCA